MHEVDLQQSCKSKHDAVACEKWDDPNNLQQVRRGYNMPERTPNNCNKEKPSLWANNETDWHSMFLDMVNFYLK